MANGNDARRTLAVASLASLAIGFGAGQTLTPQSADAGPSVRSIAKEVKLLRESNARRFNEARTRDFSASSKLTRIETLARKACFNTTTSVSRCMEETP